MTIAHIPARPEWRCTGCTEPWPCAAKRQQLVTEYAPAELRTMMALRVADAAEDLRQFGAEQLWNRFLGWLPAPGQGPVIRWVANPPLGGHRGQLPPREQIDPRQTVTTSAVSNTISALSAPPAGNGPKRTPPPRRSRPGTR